MSPSSRCAVCGLDLFAPGATCPRCRPDGREDGATAPQGAGASSPLAPVGPDERYEILDTLGRGGMGVVYKVRDRELDEVIALKVLEPAFGPATGVVDRFKREIKIARRINHPYVARLYDLVTWRGRLAISMEYIEGRSLDELVQAGPLPVAAIRRYLRYICSGLQAAHNLGVVHRDLKPANVLVDLADRAHVLDFGIALLHGTPSEESPDTVFGTPWYMSPEQAYRPETLDHRSDIYSLGVVLYRLATGEVPFSGENAHTIFEAHLLGVPVPPSRVRADVPRALEEVILRCLEKEPGRRFQAAKDVWRALDEGLDRREVRHGRGATPPVAVMPGKLGKVLVVDDDALARRMVGDWLREREVVVLEAKDGYEAVEAALREKPDLVLLDLLMPRLDGREALRILKSTAATRSIPVVMLTALDDPEEATFSKEVGAAAYLNKPVEPDVLELIVEKYLGR